MLRVYPAMDLLDGRVVRLHEGRYDRVTPYEHDPAETLASYAREGAARAHLVDLSGARDGRPTQAALVTSLLAHLQREPARVREQRGHEGGLSLQVGGGIRSMAQAEAYLEAGAERVVLGTAAVRDPAFLREACGKLPVVVAVDARDGFVAVAGWTEASEVRAEELCLRARDLGARAVLFTNIARDGTGRGPDVEATAALARAVPGFEVIASGGVGSLAHVEALAAREEIASCVVGRALYERAFTLREALAAAVGPGAAPG